MSVKKEMIQAFRFGVFVFLSFLALRVVVFAQTASLEGTVKDPSGAVVRGAEVSCVDALGTGVTRLSDREGKFRFEVVAGRNYQLIVHEAGFAAGTIQVGALKAGERSAIDVNLRLSAREDSLVVSASLMDHPVTELGSSVTVITESDLRAQQAQFVADALREVPGLAVTATGRRGGATSVFARGGNSNYDLVLLDGMKLTDFGGGLGYDFAHLVADNLGSIEVVRGPQSALYGSEAIGATINLITQRGVGTPRFFFQGEGGSFEARRFVAGANGLTRGFDWALNLSRLDTEGANFNDRYRNQNASGRLGFNWSPKTRASVHFNMNANDSGAPGAYGSDPNHDFFGLDRVSRAKNNDYVSGFTFEHEFSPRFRQRFETNFLSRNFRFLDSFGESFSDNFRAAFREESDVLVSANDSLGVGFEFQYERFFNNFVADRNGQVFALRRNNFGYFAENRWNWRQRLYLTTGVRLENFRTDRILAVPFSHNQDFQAASILSANPKIAVAYFIRGQASGSGFGYAKLHGSFGTGIRAPNGFELAFTSNPKLKPERSASFDAGVETAVWDSRAIFDVTWFYNRFRDQIVTLGGDLRQLSTFSSDNLGNARARGLEISLNLRPTAALRLGGSYTFLDSEILSLTGAPGRAQSVFRIGDPLIRRPTHSGSLFATWTHRRLILSLDAALRGSTNEIDPNLGTFACVLGMPCFFRNPGYVNANVGGSYEFRPGVVWYAKVNNFLNQKYEEVLGFPAYKLNFTSGVRITIGGERGLHLKNH